MDTHQVEKVYVAMGDNLEDGYTTLDWTLRRWSSQSISIVILHVTYDMSNDFVKTVFGKVPTSAVSDEQLQAFRLYEQEKTDTLLSKYLTFCAKAKVKAEILKVEKYDEPIHKLVVDLIFGLRITKLVLAITFMKQSSWRSTSGISGSFKVLQHKPDFCELYIVCGGKLVLRREENEKGSMEDHDNGAIIMREKTKPKSWITKKLAEIVRNSHNSSSASTDKKDSSETENEWENHVQEIESYFQHLLGLNFDEESLEEEEEKNENLETNSREPNVLLELADSKMGVVEKIRSMKCKIYEARQSTRSKREEAKAQVERSQKADWAICICNRRVEELESGIKEEAKIRVELIKDLDIEKEQLQEITSDVEESKNRLKSLLELQTELSNKLQLSTMTKSHAEVQLEKAIIARAQMVREIEELRRQRDILHRRIGFCKEKDSIGMVSRLSELSCGCREYSAEDIKLATDGFSERLRVKSGGDWTNVYRGRIHHTTVGIKLLNSVNGLSPQAFQAKMELLNNIRHPHLVAMIGFCSELKCIVYEYMHNGCLKDILFSSQRNCGKRNRALRWQDRIRIALEVCSGLAYLHLAEPRPIVHGSLAPSYILLDRNFVAKISGFDISQCSEQCNVRSDIRSFGVLLLNLLSGRNWAGLVEEAMTMDQTALIKVLDEMAGQWPLDLAEELAGIAMKCVSSDTKVSITEVMKELEVMKKKADAVVPKGVPIDKPVVDREDSSDVPSVFLCPIFQEVMKNPHVAADGFSYELEAIEEWLGMGHDTSPLTNLRLKHKFLTPNLTLRSLIQDWHNKRSVPC